MNIYIPYEENIFLDEKKLFVLVRPFFKNGNWSNDNDNFKNWGLKSSNIRIVRNPELADLILIPMFINYYKNNNRMSLLNDYNNLCKKYSIKAFGYVSGDFGTKFNEFSNIIYFRMSGFKSLLSAKNQGFPASLSDQLMIIYNKDNIKINKKSEIPIIGFCGHATNHPITFLHQTYIFLIENIKRFFKNPFDNNYEVFFQSAYQRHKILKQIEEENGLKTNFIYRKQYRAGAKDKKKRNKTTLEYYDNILISDYILCLRGTGNFSIRLYETLMMGKIPVLINTDCLLPFNKIIDWKQHVIWIEWSNVEDIPNIIKLFHQKITNENFQKLQKNNRKLWLEILQPAWTIKNLKNLE